MNLLIQNLSVYIGKRQIIKEINLEIQEGKIHALMGPNGSGKTTLAQTLMGSKNYELRSKNYELRLNGKDITSLKTDERAKEGLFLAFQNPVAIPGVSVANLLRTAYQIVKNQKDASQKSIHNPSLSVWEFNEMLVKKAKSLSIPQEFLQRSLNEEFSGGEKKKLEMLQAFVLEPKFAIFDEIDTGLDIDALKIVAKGIKELAKQRAGILLITHYQRILRFVRPNLVHILVDGRIAESGGYRLAEEVEKKGYRKWINRVI